MDQETESEESLNSNNKIIATNYSRYYSRHWLAIRFPRSKNKDISRNYLLCNLRNYLTT